MFAAETAMENGFRLIPYYVAIKMHESFLRFDFAPRPGDDSNRV